MATIECTHGPVTIDVMGTNYVFAADQFGRFVTTVWIPRHIQVFASVVAHYRLVNADNEDPWTPPETGGTPPIVPGVAPVLDSLEPNTAELGSPDITLRCLGSGFSEDDTIVFADQDEPIVFVSDEEITTGVKPTLGWGAVTVKVKVRAASGAETAEQDFSFTEPDVEGDPIALTEISGIGEALAVKLDKAGIKDVRQIAKLNKKQMAELDETLGLGGRSARDEWLIQAKKLAR